MTMSGKRSAHALLGILDDGFHCPFSVVKLTKILQTKMVVHNAAMVTGLVV